MKWRGETEAQWLERTCDWHQVYCWLPTQDRNGTWVWLDYIYRRRVPTHSGRWHWELSAEPPAADKPLGPPPSCR